MALDNTFTKWLYYGINWNFKEWYVIRETIPNNEATWTWEKDNDKQTVASIDEDEDIDFSKVVVEPIYEDVDFETFSKSDFRAVKVLNCEEVEKSKKLLKFTLDDGSGEERTILSGIKNYYNAEDLVGKTLLAIVNLPPRKMMGINSEGMIISAIHEEEGEEN